MERHEQGRETVATDNLKLLVLLPPLGSVGEQECGS